MNKTSIAKRLKTTSATALTAALTLGLTLGLGCTATADHHGNHSSKQPIPEVRGTWMTTTANTAIANPENTAASMKKLADMGLNVVYVECWKNGYTEFPSKVAEETFGVSMKINAAPAELQRDLVEETLIEAHRNGLIYIAWFEYGFMAAYKDTYNDLREQYPGWMTVTNEGELVGNQNPFVWMNPLHPQTRRFLMDIVLEAVDRYDLDGVQLDDRIAWPVTMGYDPYTVAVYRNEHNGAEPPTDPRDPEWVQWRADKVTDFAKQFYAELKAVRPNLIVSISPAIWDWSLDNYACDWKRWSHEGLMDEYIPQIYRNNFQRVKEDWPAQLEAAGPNRVKDLIAGLRVVGEGPDTTWDDLVKKMDLVRDSGAGGHCHWFSRGVLEVYPDELQAYYDKVGPAYYPMLPKDWRPLPIVAEQDAADAKRWIVRDVPRGQYRVAVKRDGRWSIDRVVRVNAGSFQMMIDDAEAVEMLLDRRATPPIE